MSRLADMAAALPMPPGDPCESEVAERSKLLYHVASALKRLARECVRLRLALHVQR